IGSSLPLPWLWALGIGGLAALGTTQRVAGWIAGLATLAVVVLAWYGLMALTGSPFRTGGLLGTFCLLILGVMPQIALGTSGVFAAQREQGEMPRARADDLVVRAHDVLRTTVAVLGGTIAVCALQMALDPETNAWGFGLLLALMVGSALRLRPFPLASQKLALWAPLVVGTAALGARAASMEGAWIWAAVAALVVLALALLLIAHLDLPEHVRAQLRQMGNSLEGVTLVTTIPVAVGMFGIYADLLRVLNP
ncbi:MAG: hypothetical protein Q4G64_05540, partial [bacterium]|nr:hypothetical protein [bacterium]